MAAVLIVLSLVFTIIGTGDASAAPIAIALLGFAGIAATPLAVGITSAILGTVAYFGINLIQKALQKKPATEDSETASSGVQFEVDVGDTTPLSFCVGRYATAGSRKYINTWGNAGKTPNAFLIDVRQIGDLAAPRSEGNDLGIIINGQRCTILWDETPTGHGYPVQEYRVDGNDYLWVWYDDGTQTTAPGYLTDLFSGDAERPWSPDMVGRGAPMVVVTALTNPELFQGALDLLFEPPMLHLYDLRKDTTAGGSGSQRWNDPSTWEPVNNPALVAYNIIRGIYYGVPGSGEWVFGGQNISATRLPSANWIAAANSCDELVDLDGGGQEPRFRCGYEIRVDQEPLSVIEEILKSCSGRLSSSAGVFKITIGVPSAAAYSVTDSDIIVTESQGFRPYPRLEEIHNAIEATYPEPEEGWSSKDAPPRTSSDLEQRDGDRRLVANVNFAAAPYPQQVQRLMYAAIEEARRFRVHEIFLPPDASALEVNDVISWSSDRNGYFDKKFLIVRKSGRRNMNQRVILKEIDPTDYDWSSDFELSVSVGPIGPIRPSIQPIIDWFAEPWTLVDASGNHRRPAIKLSWDGDQPDVDFVRFEVRLAATEEVQHRGSTAEVAVGSIIISQNLSANVNYEARGRYFSISGRAMEWSDWLPVTTPNIRLSDLDVYLPGMVEDINNFIREATDWIGPQVRDIIDENRALVRSVIDQDWGQYNDKQELRAKIEVSTETTRAYAEELVIVATGPGSVIASRLESLEVEIDTKASVSALNSQIARIDEHDGEITAVGASVTTIEASLNGYLGSNAVASAFSVLNAQVSSNNGSISAITTALTSISAATSSSNVATANFRMTVSAGPSGYASRIGFEARAGGSGSYRSASLFLDVPNSSAQPTRVGIVADQFFISSGAYAEQPFVFSGGVARLNVANIGTIYAGEIIL